MHYMYISLKGMGEEIHTISDLEDREGAAKKTCKVTQRKQEGKNSLYKKNLTLTRATETKTVSVFFVILEVYLKQISILQCT